MFWLVPALFRIGVANVFFPALMKMIVGKHSRTKRLFVSYVFCAILSWIVLGISGVKLTITPIFCSILFVGLLNGWGAYCQWRAVDISLSKNSLFTFWDDIIAMTLSCFILQEGRFLNGWSWFGVVLSFGAVIVMALHSYRQQQKGKSDPSTHTPLVFYGFVASYSVIWGVAVFCQRYWGVQE